MSTTGATASGSTGGPKPTTGLGSSMVKPSARISNFITQTAKQTFFSSDIGVLLFFVGIFLAVGLGLVILFENGVPQMRSQLLTNFIGMSLGIAFIIFVINQMGKSFVLFGHKIDVGMIYYLAILMIVMILFTG